MNDIIMTWPEFKLKALTLSYDDGVTTDKRMIETVDKYGIKATFNINTGIFGKGGETFPKGQYGRLSADEAKELYKDSGHEVAVHTAHHKWMPYMNTVEAIQEIMEDKRCIEELFGTVVRGMAYPYGPTDDTVEAAVRACGIAYARTTAFRNDFDIPENWTHLSSTCHHKNPDFKKLTDEFSKAEYNEAKLFYLWGHSYEFERDDEWELLDEFCEKLGARDDIWYATNIDVFDYVAAYDKLCISADKDRIYNPSAIPVYVKVNGKINAVIEGGAMVEIK